MGHRRGSNLPLLNIYAFFNLVEMSLGYIWMVLNLIYIFALRQNRVQHTTIFIARGTRLHWIRLSYVRLAKTTSFPSNVVIGTVTAVAATQRRIANRNIDRGTTNTVAAQADRAHNLVPVSSDFASQPLFPRLVPLIFSVYFSSSLFPFLFRRRADRSRWAFESLRPTNLNAYALRAHRIDRNRLIVILTLNVVRFFPLISANRA
jgi:hypothetical protein